MYNTKLFFSFFFFDFQRQNWSYTKCNVCSNLDIDYSVSGGCSNRQSDVPAGYPVSSCIFTTIFEGHRHGATLRTNHVKLQKIGWLKELPDQLFHWISWQVGTETNHAHISRHRIWQVLRRRLVIRVTGRGRGGAGHVRGGAGLGRSWTGRGRSWAGHGGGCVVCECY